MRRIFDVIKTYHMIEPGMHVVAGVSGGADSVCLLYALKKYQKEVPFSLTAVHVEHGLRGEESLDDASFVEKLCKGWEIPLYVAQANVKELAARDGLSVEEAGRIERYRIFEEIKRECDAQRIAVAHNQNDQAETVLHHLVRGSGLKGLCGILPVRDHIIRPLLFTGREEIEAILWKAGITWRVDQTNLNQDYTRNKIRLSVLPMLERELNGRAAQHIADAASRLREVQSYLECVTRRAAQSCIRTEADCICIRLQVFAREEGLIRQELIRRALALCGGLQNIGAVHIDALMKLAEMDCGKELSLPGGIRAVREKGLIRFGRVRNAASQLSSGTEAVRPEHGMTGAKSAEPVIALRAPGQYETRTWRITVEFLENTPSLREQIITEKTCTKWFSYDTIKNDMLFRTRRTGDYLVVNNTGGKKKLKDYMIDCKIPRGQRDHMWLVADGSHVVWMPGYRISEAAKVTENTRKIVKIHLEEKADERKDKNFSAGAGSECEDC